MSVILKRIFGCSHHNWQLVNRFPKTGVTDGRGKAWMIYYCPDCDRYYLLNNKGYFKKVKHPFDFGITPIG